jgi:hypothetical protein
MTAIALDTNLMLLLVIGRATGRVVGKRLKAFSRDDLGILGACIERCDRLIVTPNVWTEVSNIWDFGIDAAWREAVSETMIDLIKTTIEVVRPSRDVVDDPEFARLGLTDCAWLSALDNRTTLLTDDLALCQIALSRGLKAVNFNELRNFD